MTHSGPRCISDRTGRTWRPVSPSRATLGAMDALDRLEHAMSNQSRGPACTTPTLSAARPPEILSESGAATPGTSSETSGAAGETLLPESVMTSLESKKQKCAKKSKACFGCFRVLHEAKSYVNEDEELEWGYADGRGNWCGECFPGWRNQWSTTHSLISFGKYIKNLEGFDTWEWTLIAVVCLKYEDTPLSSAAIATKIEGFKFFCRLVGFPTFRYAVVPLEEYMRDPQNQGTRSEDLITCTVRQQGEDRIGVYVPLGFIDMEKDLDVAPHRVGYRRWLRCSSESDRELFSSLEGAASLATSPPPHQCQIVSYSPAKSKMEAKFAILVPGIVTILEAFSEANWTELKESSITAPLQKVSAMQTEAGANGDKEVHDLAEGWAISLLHAKSFLKLHREYVKAREKLLRLKDLGRHLVPLNDRLQQCHIEVAPTLGILLCKIKFYEDVQVEHQVWFMGEALEKSIHEGLPALLMARAEPDKDNIIDCVTSVDLFMTEFLKDAFHLCIQRWKKRMTSAHASKTGSLTTIALQRC